MYLSRRNVMQRDLNILAYFFISGFCQATFSFSSNYFHRQKCSSTSMLIKLWEKKLLTYQIYMVNVLENNHSILPRKNIRLKLFVTPRRHSMFRMFIIVLHYLQYLHIKVLNYKKET